MQFNVKESLNLLDEVYDFFEHRGKEMTKSQVKAVLEYSLVKGYQSTGEITEKEVDEILDGIKC